MPMIKLTTLNGLVLFMTCLSSIEPRPRHLDESKEVSLLEKSLKFMKHYGYIDSRESTISQSLYAEDVLISAIKTMQRYAALPETGRLDNQTLQLVTKKRCGVPDVQPDGQRKRAKRFVLGPRGWNKRHLTFNVANWPGKYDKNAVVRQINKALKLWGQYGRLSFRHTEQPTADITVAFGSGYHGDPFPFDGKGSILAHAFYPYESNWSGDIHFDDDENWLIEEANDREGTDLFTVAIHELGHSLGLAHSTVQDSVMFPYYKAKQVNPSLSYDDILAMYQLYIQRNIEENGIDDGEDESQTQRTTLKISTTSPTIPRTTTTLRTPVTARPTQRSTSTRRPQSTKTTQRTVQVTQTRQSTQRRPYYTTSTMHTFTGDDDTIDGHRNRFDSPNNDICNGPIDAVTMFRGEMFIFKGQMIWRMRRRGVIIPGYPVLIRQMFPGISNKVKSIDAAYERGDGSIVLFVGEYFWVYDGSRFIEDSPRHISHYSMPREIKKIDAVFRHGPRRLTYLFTGDVYWRYSDVNRTLDENYPKSISVWNGVPNHVEAAFTFSDGEIYFFKKEWFYRYDAQTKSIDAFSPLPSSQFWFNCPESLHRPRANTRLLRF